MCMSSRPERTGNTTATESRTEEVSVQDLFDRQKAYFAVHLGEGARTQSVV
jgi:hypothetical protein